MRRRRHNLVRKASALLARELAGWLAQVATPPARRQLSALAPITHPLCMPSALNCSLARKQRRRAPERPLEAKRRRFQAKIRAQITAPPERHPALRPINRDDG